MAIEISKAHLEAVVNYLTWKQKAQLQFWRFMQGVQPTSLNDRFWSLMDHFRKLCQYRLDRHRGEPIADAAWEFFRLALVTEPPLEGNEYLMEEAIQWFKGYKVLVKKLGKALSNLYDFHGDSFSDLIDSMPLGGQQLCEQALKTAPNCRDGFLSENEVDEAIKALPEPWRKLVGNDFYIANTLEEKAQEGLVSWMRDNVMTQELCEQIESCSLE